MSAYIIGSGGGELAQNRTFLLVVSFALLIVAVGLNIIGLNIGKWLQNAGGIGTYVPGLILILVGVYGAMTAPPANELSLATLKPDLNNLPALNLLASIAFAFAGLELASTMADEVENPRRNLPRSIFISAPLIAIVYVVGTGAVLWRLPNKDVNVISAFLQAIKTGADNISPSLAWMAPLCAALYSIGNLGSVGAWLIGPARVAFVIGLDRYFPKAFGAVHPRWHTPYVAILVQAMLATVFLLLSVLGNGTKVEDVYLILLDTQILIYFIPYLYLFIVFLIHRRRGKDSSEVVLAPGGSIGGWLAGLSGLIVTLFAMIIATIPPQDIGDSLLFRLKVIGGALGFILIGGSIYWRARLKNK